MDQILDRNLVTSLVVEQKRTTERKTKPTPPWRRQTTQSRRARLQPSTHNRPETPIFAALRAAMIDEGLLSIAFSKGPYRLLRYHRRRHPEPCKHSKTLHRREIKRQ